jgi:hypothetical protein
LAFTPDWPYRFVNRQTKAVTARARGGFLLGSLPAQAPHYGGYDDPDRADGYRDFE